MSWGDDAKLGSGLPDRFTFTVTSSNIGHPYEKNPTQAALVLDGESNVDGDLSDEHLWLKAGEQFEAGDKEGTFWIHQTQTPDVFDDPNAKIKKLNKNSAYGKFLNSVTTAENGGFGALEANQSPDREKYQIWDVTFWQGMVLDIEMVDEPYDFKDKDGNQVVGSSRQPYVRAVLGKADGVAGAPASATPAAPPVKTGNGVAELAAYDSHMGYLDEYVKATGGTAGAASFEDWKAARENVNA